ncbi:multiubiquitin domain-containing protein [Cryobacterium sp. M96]|uniref:multiubiquitin domain-containing protein n=1 Tax=Cryobacterium sp. M96 TaxID=2048295 RepID=UPI000CE4D007|nr:multiubiquitin domain-containing protein [Cryobacterium sp. M96]
MAPTDKTQIHIDGEPIDVTERRLTGAQLRAFVTPPAENLWLDVADAPDHPVVPTESVVVENGMRFFTDRSRTIYLDKVPYVVRTAALIETQLRGLPTPLVPDSHGIWKDIPDDLDDPIETGEIVAIVNGDRFFTKPLPQKKISVTVNRRPVTIHGAAQTGMSIKDSAIAQGVPIKIDFLLSRKDGPKFKPVDDNVHIRVRDDDEFRANDGDDNS